MKEKKKRKKAPLVLRILGWTVLCVLLAVLAFGGYVMMRMSAAEVRGTDPRAASEAVMPTSERYKGDAETSTLSLRFDLADITAWSANGKTDGIGTLVSDVTEGMGLSDPACGISAEKNGLRLSVKGGFHGVPVAFSVLCSPEYADGILTLTPSAVEVAGFEVPAETINRIAKVDIGSWTYSVSGFPDGLLEKADGWKWDENGLTVSGRMREDLWDALNVRSGHGDPQLAWFSTELAEVSKIAAAHELDAEEGLRMFFQQDDLGKTLEDFIVLGRRRYMPFFFLEAEKNLGERMLPGHSDAAAAERKQQLKDETAKTAAVLESEMKRILSLWKKGRITIRKGQFLLDGKKLELFTSLSAAKKEAVSCLDLSSVKPVIVGHLTGDHRGVKRLRQLCDSASSLTGEINMNMIYSIGLVFTGVNGDRVLVYDAYTSKQTTAGVVRKEEVCWAAIDPAKAAELDAEGKAGVIPASWNCYGNPLEG